MSTNHHEKALVTAESVVQDDQTNFERYSELGWAYFHAERLNDAMATFQRAVALNPRAARA